MPKSTGEAAVSAATIAIQDEDAAATIAIQERCQADAVRFWLEMGEEEGGEDEEGGKTRELKRTKVWKWLLVTWHMMAVLGVGWTFFQQPLDPSQRGDPVLWPSITVSLDQGSDGWSAVHYLRHIGVNVIVLPDLNHRCWNDTQLAIQDSGLWFWCLVCVAILNLDTGPWETTRWRGAMKENANQYAQVADVCQL